MKLTLTNPNADDSERDRIERLRLVAAGWSHAAYRTALTQTSTIGEAAEWLTKTKEFTKVF